MEPGEYIIGFGCIEGTMQEVKVKLDGEKVYDLIISRSDGELKHLLVNICLKTRNMSIDSKMLVFFVLNITCLNSCLKVKKTIKSPYEI